MADTGVGAPDGFHVRQSESLGLQLVGMLTEQLGPTPTVARHGGTAFTLTFPLPEAPAGHTRPAPSGNRAKPRMEAAMPETTWPPQHTARRLPLKVLLDRGGTTRQVRGPPSEIGLSGGNRRAFIPVEDMRALESPR